MAQQSDQDRVWDMMDKITTCMLATRDGDQIRARPMAAYVRRDEGTIYFLTDVRQHKDEQIREHPEVCLAFADTGSESYVSLTGAAEVSNDRGKIRDLWNTPAKAWWDSVEDPNIRVLKVHPHDAQYWDSPGGSLVNYIKMATAAVTGSRPDMGENRKVAL